MRKQIKEKISNKPIDLPPQNYAMIHSIRAIDYISMGVPADFDKEIIRRNKMPAGFVMLFDEKLNPIKPANLYLRYKCYLKIRRKWKNTQQAYADDLAQWWKLITANNLEWNQVEGRDIQTYANSLIEGVSIRTGQEFANNTIARRVGTVESFYRLAYLEGLIEVPIIEDVANLKGIPNERAMLPHVGARRRGASINKPKISKDDEVRPFSLSNLAKVINYLGPSQSQKRFDSRPQRDRLMAELALQTGMRVEEVCSINAHEILDLRNSQDKNEPMKPIF